LEREVPIFSWKKEMLELKLVITSCYEELSEKRECSLPSDRSVLTWLESLQYELFGHCTTHLNYIIYFIGAAKKNLREEKYYPQEHDKLRLVNSLAGTVSLKLTAELMCFLNMLTSELTRLRFELRLESSRVRSTSELIRKIMRASEPICATVSAAERAIHVLIERGNLVCLETVMAREEKYLQNCTMHLLDLIKITKEKSVLELLIEKIFKSKSRNESDKIIEKVELETRKSKMNLEKIYCFLYSRYSVLINSKTLEIEKLMLRNGDDARNNRYYEYEKRKIYCLENEIMEMKSFV
uniref:hypothetical protein n=1 Tax=Candidatus Ichthyocystis hellenicum TaxID=1561003 RepID=UPI00158540D3